MHDDLFNVFLNVIIFSIAGEPQSSIEHCLRYHITIVAAAAAPAFAIVSQQFLSKCFVVVDCQCWCNANSFCVGHVTELTASRAKVSIVGERMHNLILFRSGSTGFVPCPEMIALPLRIDVLRELGTTQRSTDRRYRQQ